MPSIKGTASVADNRALNKRLASVKFPANFAQKLDVERVNRAVLTQWIEEKITQLLGFEDEIVQSTAVNLFLPTRIEDGPKVEVDPKKAQIDLEGFLGEQEAAEFASEVYTLLLDAQASGVGVPKKLVEEKKKELEAQKAAARPLARGPYGGPPPPYQGGPPPPPPAREPYHHGRGARGPSPGRGPPARRSISPEGGAVATAAGRRDEFGRTSRPAERRPPYDGQRGGDGRGRRRGGYDRRESPPPYHHHHHHRRHHHHRDRDHHRDHHDRRPPRGEDYRYGGLSRYHHHGADDHQDGDGSSNNANNANNDNMNEERRPRGGRPRSRSRSPRSRRPRRRSRSLSSYSSSSGDDDDSSRGSRGGYRQRR